MAAFYGGVMEQRRCRKENYRKFRRVCLYSNDAWILP